MNRFSCAACNDDAQETSMTPQQITAWCVIAILVVMLYNLLERMIIGA